MSDGPVLLIEDNADDQLLTLRALRKQGIENAIVVKNDGVEAIDYLRSALEDQQGELPALILMDLKMPRIDGHEVLKRIKEDVRLKRIPVVMLTSSREVRDITTAYDLGANSYVRKPIDSARFNEVAHYLCSYWLDINERSAVAN
jgi:two-component system response regulator